MHRCGQHCLLLPALPPSAGSILYTAAGSFLYIAAMQKAKLLFGVSGYYCLVRVLVFSGRCPGFGIVRHSQRCCVLHWQVGIPGPGAHPLLWRRAWRDKVLPALVNFKPDLILVSAGFDAHIKDEINFR